MKVLNQQFQIKYHYPVHFTTSLFDPANRALAHFLMEVDTRPEQHLLVVADTGLWHAQPALEDTLINYFHALLPHYRLYFVQIPAGEEAKNNPIYLEEILRSIDRHGLDRHSLVIGIGGGAVLDLAGYAAAIAHRGIRHIRIPTTVLSQNDSGVGVKNGINFLGKKNFLGTFAPPLAVFNDISLLHTLSDRHWCSGIAEAIKVALIKDADFFHWLETHAEVLLNRDTSAMEQLIYRCAALHLAHIASGDPFESGSSRPLDFGHWSAHKLEQMTDFSLTHGEAVAIGMAIDVLYSGKAGWLDEDSVHRILRLLEKLQFSLYHPLLEEETLLEGLREFREHLGGELTIMLLRAIGTGDNTHTMDHHLIQQCIADLRETSDLHI
jgi:3-dehydroquinate synthase